ncbi:hypothetical protein ElyMa_000540300 [Elysia marginata]|uniref:Galectin n=1 Tax=Elysia marginata TaxID=1093978 RepID=A0AAV4G277_9GAST|nr:hypothetical protein ElyMa_000540300 [Elysia marginata]
MLWLQDGNANTCNDGTVTPPVVIVPFFKTAVTYMRITLQQPGLLQNTSVLLDHFESGKKITMKCSRRLTLKVDETGKMFDIPCFSRKVVHSITFDGEGARQLCEVLLSPGRNIVVFGNLYEGSWAFDTKLLLRSYIKSKTQSKLDCTMVGPRGLILDAMTTCEINMVSFYKRQGKVKALEQ